MLEAVAGVLAGVRDIVEERVVGPTPTEWCVARGWDRFLLELPDEQLGRCEEVGLAAIAGELGAPEDLTRLVAKLKALGDAFRPLGPGPVEPAAEGASARKRSQVAALSELCAARVGDEGAPAITRVVDVGAGRGHLTRELASALGLPAVGLERDDATVSSARELTEGGAAAFETFVATPDRLAFEAGDLAVGLHACGSLGDTLTLAAARDQVDLLLVNCCLQKVEGSERKAVSALGKRLGVTLRRDLLGLTNLGGRRRVSGTTARVMETRRTRYGLLLLLRGRGLTLSLGDEMRGGLQPRHARQGLARLAERALAKRELEPATAQELAHAEERARAEFGRLRRLCLPRSMLGRLLEWVVVLDRACALEEAGHDVAVRAVFDFHLSPRNLGVIAWRR
jgi:SAM-dependent methyltransferase